MNDISLDGYGAAIIEKMCYSLWGFKVWEVFLIKKSHFRFEILVVAR